MRRIIILGLTLAMSAFALNNCAYPDWEPEAPSENTGGDGGTTTPVDPDKAFSVTAGIAETKTAATEAGSISWAAEDQINVFHAVSGETTFISDNAATINDASKNLFKGTLTSGLKKGYTYDWYMFYPYTEDLKIVGNAATVTIGCGATAVQTQEGNDSRAHVAGEAMPLYGTAMGVADNKVPATELQHLASIIEINVSNGVTPVLEVSEIKVTAPEAIVGSFIVDFVEGTITADEAASSKTATLKVNGATGLQKGESAKFYLVVKPCSIIPADGIKVSVNGFEKDIELTESLVLAPGAVTSIDFTYYNLDFNETLVGAYKIKNLWVYGGTGPQYGNTGFIDMHNKTWQFDTEAGHGIQAEMDNYLEIILVDVLDGGNKTTGKSIYWAGKDGKNWSCWFKQQNVPWKKADASHFYRQIPLGESTWVRDYTANTVTFTDKNGKETVLELYAPNTTFTAPDASNKSRTFVDMTLHAKLTGGENNWDVAGSEMDRIYYNPHDLFIGVEKVESVPEESKTSEDTFTPTLIPDPSVVPESIAGTYKYSAAYCNGGIDPAFVGFTDKSWAFNDSVWKMQDDVYVFTATGKDGNGNETGTIDFQPGADGAYWDYIMPASFHKYEGLDDLDLSSFYGKIPHGKSTYVYNKSNTTVTITNGEYTATAKYLMPGDHTINGKAHTVIASCALDFDLNYTTPNIPGFEQAWNDFERFYVAPWNYVLHLQKQ